MVLAFRTEQGEGEYHIDDAPRRRPSALLGDRV